MQLITKSETRLGFKLLGNHYYKYQKIAQINRNLRKKN